MDTFVLKDSVTGGMTDDEFLRFCLENKDLRIERNSNLEIIIMSPVTSMDSHYCAEIVAQLRNWNRIKNQGIVFDSSAGFTLPDRSVLSPDASWVSLNTWNALSENDKNKFAPICPEFVIEVRSKSDQLEHQKEKMKIWIRNGAQLAWLIDVREEMIYVFRPNVSEEGTSFDKKIIGERPVVGFELDLTLLKI